jgi:TFIIF-interacting CTD phosphatase-like protein
LLGTKALWGEPLEVKILTVSHSEGMEAIHTIRDKKNKKISDRWVKEPYQ